MITTTPDPVEFSMAGTRFTAHPNGRIDGCFKAIPFSLWECIIGFHRQVSIDMHGESVSYHKWNEAEQRYHTMIPFQKSRPYGLSVKVLWTDPRNVDLLNEYAAKYKEEFFPACTIHTHVDVGAFESGVDARDEMEISGWHITLGMLISHKEYDFDFRMRLPSTRKLKEMFDLKDAIPLRWDNLFTGDDGNLQKLKTCPGTTDWHKFIPRVEKSYDTWPQ